MFEPKIVHEGNLFRADLIELEADREDVDQSVTSYKYTFSLDLPSIEESLFIDREGLNEQKKTVDDSITFLKEHQPEITKAYSIAGVLECSRVGSRDDWRNLKRTSGRIILDTVSLVVDMLTFIPKGAINYACKRVAQLPENILPIEIYQSFINRLKTEKKVLNLRAQNIELILEHDANELVSSTTEALFNDSRIIKERILGRKVDPDLAYLWDGSALTKDIHSKLRSGEVTVAKKPYLSSTDHAKLVNNILKLALHEVNNKHTSKDIPYHR